MVFAIGHAGLTGEDGETHQGLLDLSMLTHMPNMTVLAPSNYDEFKAMLYYAVNECKGPVAVRYPKAEIEFKEVRQPIDVTKPEILLPGEDILIIACGRMDKIALNAAEITAKNKLTAEVVNIRCIKPFDKEFIVQRCKDKKLIVTLEDNITAGGMGQYIMSFVKTDARVVNLGFDTCFVPHGKQNELFELNGLDANSVAEKILKIAEERI